MNEVEFDKYSDEYEAQHKANIAVTGEDPSYFAEYKIRELKSFALRSGILAKTILDFGSGIGNSIPFFRQHFSSAALTCADVSSRSIALSQGRFPGPERYVKVGKDTIPIGGDTFDAVFSACVFHHIPHEEHGLWLRELLRVTRPGGMAVIFEHNPWNPLTVRAVNTCPFDENARLITSAKLRKAMESAGWREARVRYFVFFPRALAALRVLESSLAWLPLGAQYAVCARKP